jgi:hypothetical protein
MDRPGIPRRAGLMSFKFDLVNRVAIHDYGFVIPIADLYDRDGEYTEEAKDAVVIGMFMPPDGLYVTLDLRDLKREDIVTSLQ